MIVSARACVYMHVSVRVCEVRITASLGFLKSKKPTMLFLFLVQENFKRIAIGIF